MSVIDVMSEAAGFLDYAADALEAPVGSHVRETTRDLKAARETVAAMLAALEKINERYNGWTNYATWTGHMASCRRVVSASDHSHALDIVRERVRGFKRFMGKLSMDCVEMRAVS